MPRKIKRPAPTANSGPNHWDSPKKIMSGNPNPSAKLAVKPNA